jgi:hypothetical protein
LNAPRSCDITLHFSLILSGSCLVKLDRSFECPACKQQEAQQGALFVRAADGRCLSVFHHGPQPFTVLKVMVQLPLFALSLMTR